MFTTYHYECKQPHESCNIDYATSNHVGMVILNMLWQNACLLITQEQICVHAHWLRVIPYTRNTQSQQLVN